MLPENSPCVCGGGEGAAVSTCCLHHVNPYFSPNTHCILSIHYYHSLKCNIDYLNVRTTLTPWTLLASNFYKVQSNSLALFTEGMSTYKYCKDGTIVGVVSVVLTPSPLLQLWNTLAQCKYTIQEDGHSDWVSCVRFSPSNSNPIIVSCGWDKAVKVGIPSWWDLITLHCYKDEKWHNLRYHADTLCGYGSENSQTLLSFTCIDSNR